MPNVTITVQGQAPLPGDENKQVPSADYTIEFINKDGVDYLIEFLEHDQQTPIVVGPVLPASGKLTVNIDSNVKKANCFYRIVPRTRNLKRLLGGAHVIVIGQGLGT